MATPNRGQQSARIDISGQTAGQSTPTILEAASDCRQRRWVLLEASGATTAALASACPGQVLRCDLASDDLPDLGARAVVADPPWYPADTRSFLWAAARITRP